MNLPASTPDTRADQASIDMLIDLERAQMVARLLPTSVAGSMIVIVILSAVMWPVVEHGYLLACAFGMTLNQGWRFWIYLGFRRHGLVAADVAAFSRRWLVGAGISGVIWSAVAILYYVPDSPIHQTLLVISVFGITAVAIPLIAPYPISFRLFAIPIMLALTARLLWEGDPLHVLLGFMVLIKELANLNVGQRYYLNMVESLRVRYENEMLAARLGRQNVELDRARIAAEQASRAKTRFFAAASHDLRQPLHAIGLFVDLLTGRMRNPQDRRLVGNIETSVAALETLFDALLDISKIDAGAIRPAVVDFDPRSLIERLRGDFEAEAGAKGLRLHLHSGAGGSFVRSDPLLVERILRNLIANAIRYTERGGVLVALRRRGERLNLEVWDTGIGIAADQQEAIFEEFFQLGNPERGQDKGLGLGLSIVRRLAELLDLPISVRSQPGRGTRFRIGLPRTDAPDPVPAAGSVELAVDFSARLILMVNDDASVRDGTATLLTNWGAQVVAGATPAEVHAGAAGVGRPDMIICDYRLADGSRGADIVADLRARFGRDVPAVVLTGTSDPERLAEARAGNYHLLLKPVRPSRLRALINASLAYGDGAEGSGR